MVSTSGNSGIFPRFAREFTVNSAEVYSANPEAVNCTLQTVNYIILIHTCRDRGPSPSQKYIPCQAPKANRPPSIKIVSDEPNRDDFIWLSALPSLCEYPAPGGTSLFKALIRSRLTDGSAFSLIVNPAVVCGQNTRQMPSLTLLLETIA
jgi:hypothetical protein